MKLTADLRLMLYLCLTLLLSVTTADLWKAKEKIKAHEAALFHCLNERPIILKTLNIEEDVAVLCKRA